MGYHPNQKLKVVVPATDNQRNCGLAESLLHLLHQAVTTARSGRPRPLQTQPNGFKDENPPTSAPKWASWAQKSCGVGTARRLAWKRPGHMLAKWVDSHSQHFIFFWKFSSFRWQTFEATSVDFVHLHDFWGPRSHHASSNGLGVTFLSKTVPPWPWSTHLPIVLQSEPSVNICFQWGYP